ncbi:hypothetical protein L1987_39264 [Smallanthus sonchifolius]|uniref:Uncharacterized protein n=1 Tax=Smallanthus sonchifolius TaxID=185202 RepID=A0ACB9HMV9_9ASTR|nr:hypothetical protein L1987_39264 [Smallanthus sonchifolius]
MDLLDESSPYEAISSGLEDPTFINRGATGRHPSFQFIPSSPKNDSSHLSSPPLLEIQVIIVLLMTKEVASFYEGHFPAPRIVSLLIKTNVTFTSFNPLLKSMRYSATEAIG